jgi:RNA polymerase sigma-70 factor, ECF subfamily
MVMHGEAVSHADCPHRLPALLKAGDPDAFLCLQAHAGRLRWILERQFRGYIAAEDLDGIVFDTLLIAFRKGPEYDPALGSVTTWLNTLAHYAALSFLRNQLDAISLDTAVGEMLAARESCVELVPEPSPEMVVVLQKLSTRRSELVRLFYYDGLTISELAERFETTEGNIRVALSRARKDIRDLLGDNE